MSDRDSIYISYRDYGEDDFNIKTMPYEKVEDTEELIEQAEAAVCETDEDRDRIDEYLVFLDNLLEHQSKFNEFKMAYEKLWTFDRTAALNAEYLAKKEAVTISYLGQRLFVYLTSDKLKALLPMKMDEDDEDDSAFYEDESVDATDDKAVDETLVAVSIENNPPLKNRYCRKCGAELFDDSVFCSKCGTRIAIELPLKETTETPIIKPVFQYIPSENHSNADYSTNVSDCTRRERNDAIIKRMVTTRETEKRNKIIKISVVGAIVAIIIILIVSSAVKSSRNAELRNFATEAMNTDYTNVYADLVSMEPEYFVYTSYNNGAYNLSEIVCKCKTVEGKTIWISVDVYEYPGGSSIEERNEPQYYTKSNPKRVVGRVRTSGQIMDELEDKIGNILVLDVSEKITK